MRLSLWLLVWTLVAAAGWKQQKKHLLTHSVMLEQARTANVAWIASHQQQDNRRRSVMTMTASPSLAAGGTGEGGTTRLYMGMSRNKMHKTKLDYEAKKNGNWMAKLRLIGFNFNKKLRQVLISWLSWVKEQRAQFLTSRLRYSVYVLECSGGKYYVGSTQRALKERWREHTSLRGGSMWTKLYKPLRILHREGMSRIPPQFYLGVESKITAKLMMIHGINNVRGAQFSDPRNLTVADLPALTGFIGHNLGMDYKEVERLLLLRLPPSPGSTFISPGESGSLPSLKAARSSTARRSQFTQEADLYSYSFLDDAYQAVAEDIEGGEKGLYCVRCGRSNHMVETCFATTTVKGRAILGQKPSSKGGGRQEKEGVCHRCGRQGHYRKKCSEEFDAAGTLIVD